MALWWSCLGSAWRTPRTRSRFLTGAVLLTCIACLGPPSCGRSGEGADKRRVVLYSSVDDYVLREVVEAFEAQTGIQVDVVGDTEATKTFGLVQRLLAERERPRADAWWSSEPFGTIRLAREGVLEPYLPGPVAAHPGGWPRGLRAPDGTWHGLAQRARVIAYHTGRVPEAEAPTTLRELIEPRWKGRVGMARPQFGTTRGHLGALVEWWGAEATHAWLVALRDNGLRLYDGNATVVRAIAQGEIDAGLTDSDDVWNAQRNRWPVGLVYEAVDADEGAPGPYPSRGALLIPNTVALVRGGPNRDGAAALIDFLFSPEAERLLAASDSHNLPVRAEIAAEFQQYAVPRGAAAAADLEKIEERIGEAMRIVEGVFGG